MQITKTVALVALLALNGASAAPQCGGGRPGSGPGRPGRPGGSNGSSGGSVVTGGSGRTSFSKGSNGQLQGVTNANSKIETVDLVINGISTAVEIAGIGITAAQLQASANLRSCIANMPACCKEIQADVTDNNMFFCKQSGVGAGLDRKSACAFRGSDDQSFVLTGTTACAAAFPTGSSS